MSTKIPPDGGWGWVIVVAFAINGLSTIPIMQGFGLIFKDTFPRFGFSATDATVIINTNVAFGMVLGLVNGPLLRHFGYRKVAVFGSLLYSVGVTLTAFLKSFPLIIFSYGILASLAMGMTMSAFSFALNSYFAVKKGRAMGLAQTIIAFGPIFMPHVTWLLISFYGFQGTILLFGAFTLHSVVGALLLQPIKWHLKKVTNADDEAAEKLQDTNTDERDYRIDNEDIPKDSMMDLSRFHRKRKTTISSIDIDHDIEVGSIYGFETPLPRQLSETLKTPSWDRSLDKSKTCGSIGTSKISLKNQKRDEPFWWSSVRSINTINLGSSIKIFEEERTDALKENLNESNQNSKQSAEIALKNDDQVKNGLLPKEVNDAMMKMDTDFTEKYKEKSALMRILNRIADFYDLGLLRDPIYVNLMLGMSIAIFAEANFSLLTPFILSDMGLSTKKIASVMSVVAGVDLLFRSFAPFLGEWLRQPVRNMYLISLCLLILSRMCLIFAKGFITIIFIAVALGAAKGIRSVYMPLVLPSYVPIDRLPYASGIQMITNGLIFMTAGPMLGIIRDVTGSYALCIFVMNCITALTVTMWIVEMIIVRRIKIRKQQRLQEDNSLLEET